MLAYPHPQVQDALSGSVESMRSALANKSITCRSSGANMDPHCHVQNDGDECRDEEIPEEDF